MLEFRTRRLTRGECLRLRAAMGHTILCCAGSVRITRENDGGEKLLRAGECFTFDRPGVALICEVEGMKDEWLADSGIAVVSLSFKAPVNE